MFLLVFAIMTAVVCGVAEMTAVSPWVAVLLGAVNGAGLMWLFHELANAPVVED